MKRPLFDPYCRAVEFNETISVQFGPVVNYSVKHFPVAGGIYEYTDVYAYMHVQYVCIYG